MGAHKMSKEQQELDHILDDFATQALASRALREKLIKEKLRELLKAASYDELNEWLDDVQAEEFAKAECATFLMEQKK